MAKLSRKLFKIFGRDGATSNFGEFGSKTAGSPVNTKDILTIQGLDAWVNGWQDAVFGANKAPFLEDMNSFSYVMGYEMAYIFENGVPEYDATTTYYTGSLVRKVGTSEIYASLTDTNLGNALPSKADNAFWRFVINKGILQYDNSYSYSTGEIAQKLGTAQLYMSLTNANVGNPLPSQVTTAIWQYLCDLANLAPPPVGVSQIKFGFAPISLTFSATATTSISKNPVGDFGFDPSMTLYAFVMLTREAFDFNAGSAPSSFGMTLQKDLTLSGTGVDASGKFIAGGSPSNTYTLTLAVTMFVTALGASAQTVKGTAVFIGVK
jgi:hypothetical protein